MAGKTYEDFLSLGLNSSKSYLNVRSVPTLRYSTVELVRFQIFRWIFQLLCQVQGKNSLLLKINCKVTSSMTVSNFKELWVAIPDNGKILACWCCNHVIPCLYEKEYTNTHGYTDPSCTSAACAWNKNTKKETELKRIFDVVVRKRRILVIRMLRLENRQDSVHCKFCIWSFPKSTKAHI